jgi:hypothetical protein
MVALSSPRERVSLPRKRDNDGDKDDDDKGYYRDANGLA